MADEPQLSAQDGLMTSLSGTSPQFKSLVEVVRAREENDRVYRIEAVARECDRVYLERLAAPDRPAPGSRATAPHTGPPAHPYSSSVCRAPTSTPEPRSRFARSSA